MKSFLGCTAKKIFFYLVFILLSSTAFGQIELGVKLGPNASRSVFDSDKFNKFKHSKFKAGFQGGLVVVFENPKNDKYALHTEVNYSRIGRKVISSNPSEYTTNEAIYHYLNLPIMFRMRFKMDAFDWYLMLGPQISYWMGGKGTYEKLDGSRNVIAAYDYKINFQEPIMTFEYMNVTDANRFQLGLNVGIGWYHELNDADRIAAGLRYYFGHSYMGIEDGGEIPHASLRDSFESINQSLELSVFYTFDIFQKSRIVRKKLY